MEMPEGALIAGSTIAQACLGVLWGGGREEVDVDVFCSAKAAPMVRSVRVKKLYCSMAFVVVYSC